MSTSTSESTSRLLHGSQLLEGLAEAAAAFGPEPAALDSGRTLTYAELWEAAGEVARALCSRDIGRDDVVALRLVAGLDLLIAMLGVLRSGSAFLVIDPSEPERRATAILEQAAARIVIGSGRENGTHPHLQLSTLRGHPGESPTTRESLEGDLGYVCFTSGSTGTPKGVMITHGALGNYCRAALDLYELRPLRGQTSLFHTSAAFDLAFTSIFPAWLAGLCVEVVAPAGGVERLAAALTGRSVGLLKMTPSHVRALQAAGHQAPNAARIVVGGEQFTTADLDYLTSGGLPAANVFNEYGPTETTVGCSVHRCGDAEPAGPIALGSAFPALELQLDRAGSADGAVELFISGAGLARGYINDPRATAAAFLPDWLSGGTGGRVYRSGDQITEDADGGLRFAGRLDRQLKIGGHRVEPEEIRAALIEHDRCTNAHVVRDGAQLTAYVELPGSAALPSLRDQVERGLPPQLRPDRYVAVGRIPLTANGKIDEQALSGSAPSAEPATTVEPLVRDVARIVGDVLREPVTALETGFRDLGGNSMSVIQLLARLEATFGVKLGVPALMTAELGDGLPNSSVRGIARLLTDGDLRAPRSIYRIRTGRVGPVPIVLAPPAGGDLGAYNRLVHGLPPDVAVFGLQTLLTADVDHGSIDSLAEHFATEILGQTPAGPVHLAGWSFGGIVAHRVAAILPSRGRPVARLTVIDSFLPAVRPVGEHEHRRTAEAYAAAVLRLDPPADGPGGTAREPLERVSFVQEGIELYSRHAAAIKAHHPIRTECPLTVVHADSHAPSTIHASFAAWQAWSVEPISEVVLAGDHDTVPASPHLPGVLAST